MKNLILLFLIALSLTGFGQTLIHADTAETVDGTLYFKWYHEQFIDNDNPFELVSIISLVKEFEIGDTTYVARPKTYRRTLRQGDSIKNPYGENYFKYNFVKNYIYTTGEDLKRTLSLYQILNYDKRIFE